MEATRRHDEGPVLRERQARVHPDARLDCGGLLSDQRRCAAVVDPGQPLLDEQGRDADSVGLHVGQQPAVVVAWRIGRVQRDVPTGQALRQQVGGLLCEGAAQFGRVDAGQAHAASIGQAQRVAVHDGERPVERRDVPALGRRREQRAEQAEAEGQACQQRTAAARDESRDQARASASGTSCRSKACATAACVIEPSITFAPIARPRSAPSARFSPSRASVRT
jgi:hypothetical protein